MEALGMFGNGGVQARVAWWARWRLVGVGVLLGVRVKELAEAENVRDKYVTDGRMDDQTKLTIESEKTRPDTRLPQSRAGGQGP